MSAIRPFRLFALAALMAAPAIYADGLKGDAAAGKALFMSSSCPACHAVTKDDTSKVGPNLVGVVGRQAGTKKSLLGPSENMKKYGVIWSAETAFCRIWNSFECWRSGASASWATPSRRGKGAFNSATTVLPPRRLVLAEEIS